jgi:outer membrane protein OmpA-like peptidoglycan-associated protein
MMQSYTKTDDKGDFKIELPYAHSYNVVINDTGNFIFSQDLQPQDNTDSLYTEIMLKKMETKKVFVFNNIQFDFDSSVIREVSYPILNDIALTLINNPEIKVEISGHTCNMGSAKYNQWLSDRRAKAIVNYLISKDVEAERMTSIGYGLSKPIADNKTLSGKKLNRRVEVKVIE